MSSSQKSKSASDNADNGGSVVDRMGTIIRNAHRAIEVLKEENSALKIANDKLQVMVDDLLSQLQSRPAPSQRYLQQLISCSTCCMHSLLLIHRDY